MSRLCFGALLKWIWAQPGAKKTAVLGVHGEGAAAQLKIVVQAPPVDGNANSVLIQFLAEMFGVAKSHVELINGKLSRNKVFLLRGVTVAEAEALLAEWQW